MRTDDRRTTRPEPPPALDRRRSRRASAVAGLAGAAALTIALALLHTFAPSMPFAPSAIAQSLVRTTPGSVDSFFIDRLGHWAQRIALLGTCVGFVLLGSVAGVVVGRLEGNRAAGTSASPGRSAWWWASLLPFWAVAVALYVRYPQSTDRWTFAAVTLPLAILSGGFAGRSRARLAAAPERRRVPTDLTRRYAIRSLTLGGLGVALGVANLGRLLHRRPDPGQQRLAISNVSPPVPRHGVPSDAHFAHVPGLTPEVTSIAAHYVVDEELIDPDIDPVTWRLAIGGKVGRPFRMSYDQLKGLPAVERYQTLECVSNKVGGNLISTARWTGVPLKEILDRAGVPSTAMEVVFAAAGGYSDSLPIDHAMDDSTLIAIGMNGHVLPRSHGFPARVLSVGTYGMKNPKWLESIVVVDRPYQGFWEQRGWTKQAVVKTSARIDTPIDGAQLPPKVTVAGVAFAGDRGVSKVEVSTDGGRGWHPAELRTALGPYTWRQWLYRFSPQETSGQATILARAYDGAGMRQSPVEAQPYPSGSSGYDAASVSL
ncbi:MAG: molybdopterin-dependent oxidoreductase [Actinomycetota bacterium]|nr:molybdopterin-dependent oxidoreductase [Actinomycetota bacterium]